MTALRIGIVGSRFAARLHLLAYRRVYGVEARIVGVTSPTAERREAFARDSGATSYPDLDALLPHVDVVDVCSPPATHEPVALRAIEAGKHVVIEKPFTGAFGPPAGAAASCSRTRRTGSTRRPCRRSARSWRRRTPRSSGCSAESRTAARIRPSTASGVTRAAARSSAR